jgi:hypothetical protein
LPANDPTERALLARVAAHRRWAKTDDRTAATAAARKGLLTKFEREVDPDGKLDPAERARRAESARQAFYASMSAKSAKARRLRRQADAIEAEVDAELTAEGAA